MNYGSRMYKIMLILQRLMHACTYVCKSVDVINAVEYLVNLGTVSSYVHIWKLTSILMISTVNINCYQYPSSNSFTCSYCAAAYWPFIKATIIVMKKLYK